MEYSKPTKKTQHIFCTFPHQYDSKNINHAMGQVVELDAVYL